MKTIEKIKQLFWGLIGASVLLLIWWIAFKNQKQGTYLVPNPISTFEKFSFYIFQGGILKDLGQTLFRMLAGYFLATVFGVSCGLLLGSFKFLRRMFEGTLDFLRSIPVTSLLPIFIIVFGIGSESKIAMIFWASFFIICINTTYGVIQANPIRREMAKLYGANWYQIFVNITIYESLPYTMVGLRVGVSFALIVSILTEMYMGAQFGIGQKITEAYNLYQIDSMYALIIITGVLGLLLNVIFIKIEKSLAGWKLHVD